MVEMTWNLDVNPGELIHRRIWVEIERWMDEPEIIVIKGPRQAGKTTTLEYLRSKYGGVYLTLEDDDVREAIGRDPKGFIQRYLSSKRQIIYLDEAQYIKNIGHILKMWYDLYKSKLKLVVSGSGSFDVKVEVGRHLVGRLVYFEILPLDFSEFLLWKDEGLHAIWKREHEKVLSILKGAKEEVKDIPFVGEMNRYLEEYLMYGGFPRVVLETDQKKKQILLRNLYQTYVERCCPFFGNKTH